MPRLTDTSLRALAVPSKGQRTYFDEVVPGFGCRVSQGGTKSFIVQLGADRRLITIGRYPLISLAKAREEAKRLMAERTLGRFRPQSIPWDEARELFLATCAQKNKPRTVRDYRRLLKRHFPFGRKKVSEITPQDINHRIDRLRDTVSEQNHALVAIKIFFSWAQRRHYVQHSPCEGMQIVKRRPRTRVLSPEELAAVYATALNTNYPFGPIVQLCILTGQRRGEIVQLRRSYISGDTVTLPPSITKNNRTHTFPIGNRAQSVIKNIPGDDDLLFIGTGGKGIFSDWSKKKTAFDRTVFKNGFEVRPWTLHDLRRTFASGLASLGIRIEVVEKLLNHVSGSFAGVAGIYQRHTYMEEMRAAIGAWEKHVASLHCRDWRVISPSLSPLQPLETCEG
ncbi:tyrosine-type recombinase/integrase [Bradyrhizobium diazoefficiens]|uniref:Integrase n=1 Tax=Bradyrhizobium diazoefficiens TaxID=1355477 RepID=A0A809WZE5_9BRAD|nr:integrase [Bradyrhizobium diazoefficiens]BCE46467.1 integrase [Bradyrhizobium diazoefficiens]BCE89990.1 integrase [Bradyrhizobium diazoefficiens]BCF24933.1 integrase [Bradyrhizobium diazoefficiens]